MTWTTSPQDRYDESERLMRELDQQIWRETHGVPTRQHPIDCTCRRCRDEETR